MVHVAMSEGRAGHACVPASALTAPQGGSMLREGTDPSRRIHPSVHRGGYTPGIRRGARRSLQPSDDSLALSLFPLPRAASPPFALCCSIATTLAAAAGTDIGVATRPRGYGSIAARDNHYPPLTNHLDHRLQDGTRL